MPENSLKMQISAPSTSPSFPSPPPSPFTAAICRTCATAAAAAIQQPSVAATLATCNLWQLAASPSTRNLLATLATQLATC